MSKHNRAKEIIKVFIKTEIETYLEVLGEDEPFELKGFKDLTVKDILEAYKVLEGEGWGLQVKLTDFKAEMGKQIKENEK